MIKIKKIPLAVVNEDIVIGAKTMLSGAIGKIPVEGVGDVDFATLFESIFKDATYILEGKLPEKCFEKKDKILIKVSIQFENELENFYSISDLEIGTVTLVGIYRGKFNKIDIMKKLNRFMESDGLSIEESADYLGVESDDEPEGGNVMSFSDWLLIGGAALLIKNGMKKEVADREEAEEEYNRYMADFELQQSEWERSRAVNNKRRNMPCFFNDGLSYSDFEEIAKRAGRKIKRVKDVTVRGGVIYCNAESQTGYSDWNFNVDFNDWGHVTGTYWTQTDNSDSSIPHHYGHMVSGWIHDFYRERGISLMDLSDFVDSNKDLETDKGLNYTHKEKFFSRVFGGNNSSISIGCGTENVIGEHLYPVISMLRDSGFKNIKTFAIQDINNRTSGYCYQVEQVVINGSGFFERGMFFPENTEIYVSYHDKQMIRMPFSQFELKRGNYITVGDKLKDLGFTQIYERKIEVMVYK